jgi:uncharacterized membrane protein
VVIRILFVIMVLSAVALIGVALAVFVRVWWYLRRRRVASEFSIEATPEGSPESPA